MTMAPIAVGAWVLSAGVAAAALTLVSARRLAEPPDPGEKVAYRTLGSGAFVVGCAALAAAGMATAVASVPTATLPGWWVLSVVAVVLAVIDARTTWLPLPLTRLGWLAMALAILAGVGIGGGPALLGRAAVGAASAGLVYLALWRLSRGGLGFGDVRLAPLLGAATAAGSWSLFAWGLMLGSLVGGAYGLLRLVRRLPGGFPYAPAMVVGPYAACALTLVR